MLSFEQIKELIELVGSQGLQGLELEDSGFRLSIEGHSSAGTAPSTVISQAPAVVPTVAPGVVAVEPEPAAPEEPGHVLSSPIVGTFYRQPNPDTTPFVEVGDRVKKGQVLCIVEAMKLMNEIESDVDGVIQAILPKDAQAVEYGEPLFSIVSD